jgi:hypothetical protein
MKVLLVCYYNKIYTPYEGVCQCMNRPSKLTGIDAFKISNIIIYWKDIIFIMESDIKGQG